jgi:hypothetical protein
MSKPIPILLLTPSGEVAIPLQPSDMTPIAQDASLQAMIAALSEVPKAATKIHVVTMDLTAARVDVVVPTGTLGIIQSVVVKALAGTTASLKFGSTLDTAIPVLLAEKRDGFAVIGLYLNSPGGAGGTITLELQGR